ncbi:regulator of chromosome condensation 1/beta-lactamase-inhibitor protein II [Endogone sp. FLAS-F59071]|nr:regulator of chromosome condensation 1/beta-lactamase-inhibitor protein II [Endogone sp. FLAS-F59071]|eukprot:RUS17954.1 regulator of chromosome condensation 1/beta-lactamase-inhibitor protein II [Endogone sp. FLAS-F59071]
MATDTAADSTDSDPEWGRVLMCGSIDWNNINRKANQKKPGEEGVERPQLLSPHIMRDVIDLKVTAVVTGPTSCHSVLLTLDGDAYVFGRNEKGQLGLGDIETRNSPVKITSCGDSGKALGKSKIVRAAVGRNHTILVSESGAVFSCGDNRLGQLGLNNLVEHHTKVERVSALAKENIKEVACGADFTIVANDKGQLFAFGSQEYGQLGNGSDGQYIKSAGQLVTAPQQYPLPVKGLSGKHIVSVACGANHTIALDKDGCVYSWGFGGYGRLGHGEQKDMHVPHLVAQFASSNELTHASTIACGSTCSMALDRQRQFWLWGKWKNTGDGSSGQPWMIPKYFYDLNGWRFRAISGGNASLFCVAEKEQITIAWGQVQNAELGFGEDSPYKSATKPQKVEPLEGVEILSVSCGMGHTLFLAKPGNDKLADLPKFPEIEDKGDACVKCGKEDDDDKILLCDKCDAPQHMYCANPKLENVPEDDWFCDSCHPPVTSQQALSEEVEEGPSETNNSTSAEDAATVEELSKPKKRGRPPKPVAGANLAGAPAKKKKK